MITKVMRRLALEAKNLLGKLLYRLDRATVPVVLSFLDRFRSWPSTDAVRQKRYMLCCYRHTPRTSSLSVEIPTLYETLEAYSFANGALCISYFWRPSLLRMFASVRFILQVLADAPSHVILSSYAARYHYMPAPAVLRFLKGKGICVVNVWWDTCSTRMVDSFLAMDPCVDIHAVLDNPRLYFLDDAAARGLDTACFRQRILPLYYPFRYARPEGEKDIDLIFLGQTSSYRSVRMEYLQYLSDSGQAVVTARDFGSSLSEKDYDRLLLRSKVGVNFSESVDTHQLKARVFELIRAGCVVVEQRNEQTATYLSEGVHFVGFSSKEELLDNVRRYLEDEAGRKKMCEKAYEWAASRYNGDVFWQTVFQACDARAVCPALSGSAEIPVPL